MPDENYKTTPAPLLGKEGMIVYDRVYGEWELTDPLALALVELPAFQRLYKVGQYGSYWFGLPEADTNRAEHSLGVYYLLKHFGATREEQIAGLLHDISHTVFSHVIDYLHQDMAQQASQTGQDDSHAAIIAQDSIKNLLTEAGFDYRLIGDLEHHKLLDTPLPDLCADRLDYFLRDSVCYKEIRPEDARGILKRIELLNNTMVVNDPETGRFIMKHSALMTIKHWGSPWGCFMFDRTAAAMRQALKLGIITEVDFYSDDYTVWKKMKQAGDAEIKQALSDVENIKKLRLCLDEQNFDYHLTSKFRMIDPPIKAAGVIKRASELYPALAESLAAEKEKFKRGYFIRVIR